jgi:hypothetical protein
MLLWACAVLGFKHQGLLAALASFLQQQLQLVRLNSQDIANSMWALGKLKAPQPQLMAAAAEQQQLLQHSSCQELSQVLYGSAAVLRAQRLQQADSTEVLPAVALWQTAAAQVLCRRTLQGLGAAEAASLLQAAALLLEPMRQRSRRVRQQPQQHQQQQQQPQQQAQQQQQDVGDGTTQGGASSSTSSSPTGRLLGSMGSMSSMSSISSMCSMTCSLDSYEEAAAVAPAQARQLILAVDATLCQQANAGQLSLPLSAQHVAAILHSLAAAGVPPSAGFRQLLLSAAVAAAPGMDRQELAMTAWAAAKLFGGPGSSISGSSSSASGGSCSTSGSSDGVQQLMEAVDRAAGPLLQAMCPLQLSQLAWAHGRLWYMGDSLFMHHLAQAAVQQISHFGPQALSNVTWAFAQLRHYDAALTSAVGRRARALMGQFTPAELSNLTWALVTLRHRHAGLLRAVAGHAAGVCCGWDAKACVKLAVAYCSRGMPTHRYRSLLGALGDALTAKPARVWARLTPHELAQLLVAFAVGRVRHRACAAQVVSLALAQLPRMALYDLVSMVWALAMMGHCHDSLLQAVSTRVATELQGAHGVQEQQQQLLRGWGEGTGVGDVRAAEQQLSADQQQQQLHEQLDGQDSHSTGRSSSPLAAVPIDAVLGSKLKAPYLARLAWSYRTFGHDDAEWYLAAGHLLAQDSASSWSSSSSLVSSSLANWSIAGNGSSIGRQDGSSAPSGRGRLGDTPSGGSSSGTWAGDGCNGRQQAAGAAAGSDGLQRPAYRPVHLPSTASGDR